MAAEAYREERDLSEPFETTETARLSPFFGSAL